MPNIHNIQCTNIVSNICNTTVQFWQKVHGVDITHDNVCSSMLSCFYSHLLSTGRPISSLQFMTVYSFFKEIFNYSFIVRLCGDIFQIHFSDLCFEIFSCGNVNWARRSTCNICNAPKFGNCEPRTGKQ